MRSLVVLVAAAALICWSTATSAAGDGSTGAAAPMAGVPQDAPWNYAGPGSAIGTLPFGMPISSAMNRVARANGAWLAGTVNGGVWRTTDDVTVPNPHWVPVFDAENVLCSSITDIHVSTSDNNRVYTACGFSTSSQMGYSWHVTNSGDPAGFAMSNDAGMTWTMAAFPAGYSIEKILELPTGELLVAARGSYMDQNDGGIWRVESYTMAGTASEWKKVYATTPAWDMVHDPTSDIVYASTSFSDAPNAVYNSTDRGVTWTAHATGLVFVSPTINLYTHVTRLTITPGKALFMLAMLAPKEYVQTGLGAGYGNAFYLDLTQPEAQQSWQILGAQQMSPSSRNPLKDCTYTCVGCTDIPGDLCSAVDSDWKLADRSSILVDPTDPSLLYLVGNANYLAYRIDWRRSLGLPPCTVNTTSGTCFNPAVSIDIWALMTNLGAPFKPDTTDDQVPHVDCRHLAWDPVNNALMLTSDGGVFVRFKPHEAGMGFWRGWSGDIGTMEYLNFDYSPKLDRWVAGAQDNDVQFSSQQISSGDSKIVMSNANAFGLGCDGTLGLVDEVNMRMYGACQSAGELSWLPLDSSMTQQTFSLNTVNIAERGFPVMLSTNPVKAMAATPFFQMDVKLNQKNPLSLSFWANVSVYGGDGPGIFALDVTKADGSGPNATLLLGTDGEPVQTFEVGGIVSGVLREDVVVAASGKTLFVQIGAIGTEGSLTMRDFPVPFGVPISPSYTKSYCELGIIQACTQYVQSWPNHARTQSMAVDPLDTMRVAVSGWATVADNSGMEHLYYTPDKGDTFYDIIGNLAAATRALVSHARPMGLCFVNSKYLLAGTINGIFVTDVSNVTMSSAPSQQWFRLGGKPQLPMVKVAAIKYYPTVDRLITATFGRGVYILNGAASVVAAAATGNAVYPPPGPPGDDSGNDHNLVKIIVPIIAGVVLISAILLYCYCKKKRGTTGDGYDALQDTKDKSTRTF